MSKKLFVLDSSVLIHDPKSPRQFEEHTVGIPFEVLEELDRIKSEPSLRGKHARQAQREVLALLGENDLENRLEAGGSIRILMPTEANLREAVPQNLGSSSITSKTSDNKIILTALWAKGLTEFKNTHTKLVTKDIGMHLKARACGVGVEDYKFDKGEAQNSTQIRELSLSKEEFETFNTNKQLTKVFEKDSPSNLEINSYGLFTYEQKVPWRYIGENTFQKVENVETLQRNGGPIIKPRSLEQLFFLDALLDTSIDLVTAKGVAGTGKTLLTMAACLQMIEKGIYSGLCIAKPNESVGKGLGFLPGTLDEKLEPWLQPYSDAINFLHYPPRHPLGLRYTKGGKQSSGGRTPYEELKERGLVEITAIEYIRGRSIPNKLFVLDEVQNVPQPVLKTIVSRLGEGSKLICLGDTEQVDNPYLDSSSNGLTHIRTAMKNLKNTAHITMVKGERSLLAQQATKLL
jgi:PhoH-like ATPase